jgi:hypothetical protein
MTSNEPWLKASRAMNAAYALQTAELVGIPPLAIPYQAADFEALARELIAITAPNHQRWIRIGRSLMAGPRS